MKNWQIIAMLIVLFVVGQVVWYLTGKGII